MYPTGWWQAQPPGTVCKGYGDSVGCAMARAPVTRTLVVSTGSSAVCMTGAAGAGGCTAPNVIQEMEVARALEWATCGSAGVSTGVGGVAFCRRRASARSASNCCMAALLTRNSPATADNRAWRSRRSPWISPSWLTASYRSSSACRSFALVSVSSHFSRASSSPLR